MSISPQRESENQHEPRENQRISISPQRESENEHEHKPTERIRE